MGNWALQMIKESLDAFVNADAGLARKVCADDDFVDDLTQQLFRELLSFMLENQKTITRAIGSPSSANTSNVLLIMPRMWPDSVYLAEGKIIRHTVPPVSSSPDA